MMITINCPVCGSVRKMSLVEPAYRGPLRCWKCRGLFTIVIEDDKLVSCQPLSEADLQRQQELKALQDKMRRD